MVTCYSIAHPNQFNMHSQGCDMLCIRKDATCSTFTRMRHVQINILRLARPTATYCNLNANNIVYRHSKYHFKHQKQSTQNPTRPIHSLSHLLCNSQIHLGSSQEIIRPTFDPKITPTYKTHFPQISPSSSFLKLLHQPPKSFP